ARRGWTTASPLGQMFILMVEVCGNAEKDPAAAKKSLDELRKGQENNYPAMTAALLCMNEMDEAAALIKKRLGTPSNRAGMLGAVQHYNAPRFVTAFRKRLIERHAAVIARPDVKAEVEKYGRVETLPYISPYWGNL